MKKFLSFILIFCVSFSYSQTWSSYGIKVAPENEETVVKIMDDYFTKNKIEGVTSGISLRTVETQRYRLLKKLEIDQNLDLNTYIQNII